MIVSATAARVDAPAIPGFNREDASNFFWNVMPDLEASGLSLSLWNGRTKLSHHATDIEEALDVCERWVANGDDVYYGVCPRRSGLPPEKRGGVDDVACVVMMWAEVDLSDPEAHKGDKRYPTTIADVRRILSALGLEPTGIIHSGHGVHLNWLLTEPIYDIDAAKLLSKRFGDHFASVADSVGFDVDPISDLPRLLRVPGTVNFKAEPKPVQVQSYTDRRYTVAEFEALLPAPVVRERPTTLRLAQDVPPRRAQAYANAALENECDNVASADAEKWNHTLNIAGCKLGRFIAAGTLDEATVVSRLTEASRQRGHEGSEVANTIHSGIERGKRNPFVIPEPDPARAPVKCHVSDTTSEDGEQLATITINDRPLAEVSDDVLDAMVQRNDPPSKFTWDSRPARIERRENGEPKIARMGEYEVRGVIARDCRCVRAVGDEGVLKHVAPPMDVVRDICARSDFPFPPVSGVVEAPSMRPDGTILDAPGYDPATRLYYAPFEGLDVPHVADRPERDDIAAAVDLLDELICDFPFADEASKANMIGAILSLVLRELIAGPVPLGVLDKSSPGTGGSYLSEVASIVATGRSPSILTVPADDDELRKRLTARLSEGAPLVVLDNLDVPLGHSSLAAMLTATEWSDRILGRSETIRLPNRAVFIANGNNIRLAGDMPRRCFWIRLDAKMPRPWERPRESFRHPDLRGWVKENRGRLLWAALTMARGWVAAGRPASSTPVLGSFEAWSTTIGGILAFAGVEGFLANQRNMYELGDDESPAWEAFLSVLRDSFATASFSTSDVHARVSDPNSPLADVMPDNLVDALEAGPGSFKKRLGKALASKAGVRYGSDELHVLRAGTDPHRKVAMWKVSAN